MVDESWAPLHRRGLYLAILASFGMGLFCLWMAQHPGDFGVAPEQLSWEKATCRVLTAGVDYRGTCPLDEGRYDITRGNYSECSTFVWCADEGGTCECDGTVRYGAPRETILAAGSVELQVQGSIRCTNEAFKQDPAMFRAKRCLCRPSSLEKVAAQAVLPSTCASVKGYMDWVQPATAGDCSRSYLPWALVTVRKALAPEGQVPARCAYGYGLAQVSLTADPAEAKSDLAALEPGADVPCLVLTEKDSYGLGNLEDCVVALKTSGRGLTTRWAAAWSLRVRDRHSSAWLIVAGGFAVVLGLLLLRLPAAEARELPAPERQYIRLCD